MKDLSSEVIREKVYAYSSIPAFKEKDFYPQAMCVFNNYCGPEGAISKKDTRSALRYCFGWSKQKINTALAALPRHGLIIDGESEEAKEYAKFFEGTEECYLSGFTCKYRENRNSMSGFTWLDDKSMIVGVSFDTEKFFEIMQDVDDITLKLYIYLSIQDSYWKSQKTSYMFHIRGKNGLVDNMGYSQSNSTAQKMSGRLKELANKGYIEYSEPQIYKTRFGKPIGQSMQLIRVNR